jgi:hypothetical protein
MKFRYLRDPLFLSCVLLYFVNRFVIKKLVAGGFFHDYFNDLICIPFWVPIMLFFERKTRMRPDDAAPRWYEIIIPLVLWSYIFEVYLPGTRLFRGRATADARDVLYYCIGALGAAVVWRVSYRERKNL